MGGGARDRLIIDIATAIGDKYWVNPLTGPAELACSVATGSETRFN